MSFELGTDIAGSMADSGETYQGDARNVRARRGGHDISRGPSRGRNFAKPAHQIQRESHLRKFLFV
jgi:hypothetical protein